MSQPAAVSQALGVPQHRPTLLWCGFRSLRRRFHALRRGPDDGSAIVEFIFVAVLVLVPLVYLIVTVAVVQRGRLAVTNASRDVGRAIATSTSATDVDERARTALRIALSNEGISPSGVELRYVAAGSGCDDPAIAPLLTPGAVFAVCVTRREQLPAVPSVLSGRGVTLVGKYVVHIDQYAASTP